MLPWLQTSEPVHVSVESAREQGGCLDGTGLGFQEVVSALWLSHVSEVR